MEPISLGLTALSIGSSLFGMFNRPSGNQISQTDMMTAFNASQQNALRQQQMNLDAIRRKRDIVRNAQVAQANATAIAYNQGAGQSSALSGALSGITGQADTAYQGVAQNQEMGNQMFDLQTQKALLSLQSSQQQNRIQNQQAQNTANVAFGSAIGNNSEKLGKLGQWGWGQFSNSIAAV